MSPRFVPKVRGEQRQRSELPVCPGQKVPEKPLPTKDGRVWGRGSSGQSGRQAGVNHEAVNDREADGFQSRLLTWRPRQHDGALLGAWGNKIAVSAYLYTWQQEYYFTVNAIFSMLGG